MKIDPYKHKERYLAWKESVKNGIPDISKENNDLVYLSSGLRPSDLDSLILGYKDSLPMFRPLIKRHNLPEGGELKSIFCEENS